MTVRIKVLKGYINPINNEFNTLTLLIKSSYEIEEHLSKAKEKLLTALTRIIKEYENDKIEYYHKVQIQVNRDHKFPTTKNYLLSIDSMNLENSFKELSKIVLSNKLKSHFANIIVTRNNETIKLTEKEFSTISENIMKELITINNDEDLFTDKNDKVKSKDANKTSLFIDDDDVKPFKKNKKVNNASDSLFIDDDDIKTIKKNNKKCIK